MASSKQRYQTSRLTPFLRRTLGYAQKTGVSFWVILEKALAVHGVIYAELGTSRDERKNNAFNTALHISATSFDDISTSAGYSKYKQSMSNAKKRRADANALTKGFKDDQEYQAERLEHFKDIRTLAINAKVLPVKHEGIDVRTDDFLKSYAWRKARMIALKRYGARCQCCGATPADGATMNVDHIKPRRIYPELALDIDNLQVLCHDCNHGKGNWDMTDWRTDDSLDADSAAHLRSIVDS